MCHLATKRFHIVLTAVFPHELFMGLSAQLIENLQETISVPHSTLYSMGFKPNDCAHEVFDVCRINESSSEKKSVDFPSMVWLTTYVSSGQAMDFSGLWFSDKERNKMRQLSLSGPRKL